jgi:hypothetical protein
MTSKYAQALGLWEFKIKNVSFTLKPYKGDNLKFMKLQQGADKDQFKLIEGFVPFMAEIIARSEKLEAGTEEYEQMEFFVEQNVMSFLKETMIGFGWVSREQWEENEAAASKKLLESGSA